MSENLLVGSDWLIWKGSDRLIIPLDKNFLKISSFVQMNLEFIQNGAKSIFSHFIGHSFPQ